MHAPPRTPRDERVLSIGASDGEASEQIGTDHVAPEAWVEEGSNQSASLPVQMGGEVGYGHGPGDGVNSAVGTPVHVYLVVNPRISPEVRSSISDQDGGDVKAPSHDEEHNAWAFRSASH